MFILNSTQIEPWGEFNRSFFAEMSAYVPQINRSKAANSFFIAMFTFKLSGPTYN